MVKIVSDTVKKIQHDKQKELSSFQRLTLRRKSYKNPEEMKQSS